jgi:hypothetical protein
MTKWQTPPSAAELPYYKRRFNRQNTKFATAGSGTIETSAKE